MTNKQIYIGLAVSSAVWTLLSVPAASADPYYLEGGTVHATPAPLEGGGMVMEGGIQDTQTYGASPSFVMEPLQAGTYCGDGRRQGGEACDGNDVPATACQSAGFIGGNATCSDACTVVTATCQSAAASSAAAANPSQGNGGARASAVSSAAQRSSAPAITASSEASLSFLPVIPDVRPVSSAPARRPVPRARSSAALRPAAEPSFSASSSSESSAVSGVPAVSGDDGDASSQQAVGQVDQEETTPPSISSLAAMLGSETSGAGASALLLSCIVLESACSALLARLYRFRKTYESIPAYAFSNDLLTA